MALLLCPYCNLQITMKHVFWLCPHVRSLCFGVSFDFPTIFPSQSALLRLHVSCNVISESFCLCNLSAVFAALPCFLILIIPFEVEFHMPVCLFALQMKQLSALVNDNTTALIKLRTRFSSIKSQSQAFGEI